MCERIAMPGGGHALICGGHRRQRCACGKPATLLCDWRMPAKPSGTCDAPICRACAMSPAPAKDLCRAHAQAFDSWRAARPAPIQGVML